MSLSCYPYLKYRFDAKDCGSPTVITKDKTLKAMVVDENKIKIKNKKNTDLNDFVEHIDASNYSLLTSW